MIELREYLSPYVSVLITVIGIYMLMVQGPNLRGNQHLLREGQFCKLVGRVYIGLGIVSLLIWIVVR